MWRIHLMDRQYTWQNYYIHAAPRCLQVLACFTRVQVLHALLLGKAWLKTCMQRCVGILQYKYSHTFSQRYSQYLHSNLQNIFTYIFTISSQNLHITWHLHHNTKSKLTSMVRLMNVICLASYLETPNALVFV